MAPQQMFPFEKDIRKTCKQQILKKN